VLILLLKLILCNLVRMVCLRKRAQTRQQDQRAHYLGGDRHSGQSQSLLSLPPYDVVFSELNAAPQAEYLPTYEEALESVRLDGGDTQPTFKVFNTEKASQEVA